VLIQKQPCCWRASSLLNVGLVKASLASCLDSINVHIVRAIMLKAHTPRWFVAIVLANMLPIAKAHVTFLDSVLRSMGKSDSFDWTRHKHKEQIINAFKAMSPKDFNLADAGAAMEYINGSCFDAAEKDAIVTTINAMMSGEVPVCSTSRDVIKPQEHFFIFNYLSEADWASLRNANLTLGSKIAVLVKRCGAIGLYSLTEKTARSITATLVVAHGQPCDHSQAYEILQIVKDGFKKLRSRRPAGAMPTLHKFPENIDDFLKVAPTALGDDAGAIPCPIDIMMIKEFSEAMPCRKTHNALKQTPLASMPSSRASSLGITPRNTDQHGMLQDLVVPLANILMRQMAQPAAKKMRMLEGLGHEGQQAQLAITDGHVQDKTTHLERIASFDGSPSSHASSVEGASPRGTPASETPTGATPPGKTMAESIAAIQAAIQNKKGTKAQAEPEEEEDEQQQAEGDVAQDSDAPKKAGGKAKAKGEGKAKAKGEGKAKAKAGGKAKAKANGKGKDKAAEAVIEKPPPYPGLKKVPPIHYLACTVYCDLKHRQWRAVAASNRRKDVRFSWKDGMEGWKRCLHWCETHE